MVEGKIHVGDKLTDIQLVVYDTNISGTNVVVNFSTTPASTLEIIVTDPDGNTTTKSASLLNPPGTDGIIHVVNSDATLFDMAGAWSFSAHIIFSDTGDFTSNPIIKEVI